MPPLVPNTSKKNNKMIIIINNNNNKYDNNNNNIYIAPILFSSKRFPVEERIECSGHMSWPTTSNYFEKCSIVFSKKKNS